MAERTKATVLKTVVLRAPVNEWLGPMKEAPSFEGRFLFQRPPIGKGLGAWYLEGMGMGAGAGASRYTGSAFHDGGGLFYSTISMTYRIVSTTPIVF